MGQNTARRHAVCPLGGAGIEEGLGRVTFDNAWRVDQPARSRSIRLDSTWSPVSPTTETPAPAKRAKRANGAAAHDGMRLVIVESPAKAKTIAGYLGPGYVVEASIG